MPGDDTASPLERAAHLHRVGEDFALLFSGLKLSYSGDRSLLAYNAAETITADRFDTIPTEGQWFGWLGYGLRHDTEMLPHDRSSHISLPPLCLTRFNNVETFPHRKGHEEAPEKKEWVATLSSNMTRTEYLEKVQATIEQIHAGNFYQANITRKFYGELKPGASPETIFRRLCSASPSPYSTWIRMGDAHILSSSPELFLKITPDGRMVTRPIKGSAPPSTQVAALQSSPKDRAENLMITDLMRNDFSHVARKGSVRVSELFGTDSFSTIHHLSSTVEAELAPEHSVRDAIRACFPPGSMTGAPKIAAMQWCSKMEGMERNVYSGAIGWIAPDACELSVVIRTLVIEGSRFEFQVGGGIVADSDAEAEWRETMTKARGITQALGIEEEHIASL